MKPIILYRHFQGVEEEVEVMKQYFDVTSSRVGVENRLVIPRYSALPFYRELELDLLKQNSHMLNSLLEHQYVANFDYYFDVTDLTPKSYFALSEVPKSNQAFILKGRTNGRKEKWHEKMFAKDYADLVPKYLDLTLDPLIQNQGVVIRDYVPLKSFGTSLSGVPHANEWRFFFYKTSLLSYGYYWSGAEHVPSNARLAKEAIRLAEEVARRVSKKVNFFAVDVAETAAGSWILIEINDGQMSGLSANDPHRLYKNLYLALGSKQV